MHHMCLKNIRFTSVILFMTCAWMATGCSSQSSNTPRVQPLTQQNTNGFVPGYQTAADTTLSIPTITPIMVSSNNNGKNINPCNPCRASNTPREITPDYYEMNFYATGHLNINYRVSFLESKSKIQIAVSYFDNLPSDAKLVIEEGNALFKPLLLILEGKIKLNKGDDDHSAHPTSTRADLYPVPDGKVEGYGQPSSTEYPKLFKEIYLYILSQLRPAPAPEVAPDNGGTVPKVEVRPIEGPAPVLIVTDESGSPRPLVIDPNSNAVCEKLKALGIKVDCRPRNPEIAGNVINDNVANGLPNKVILRDPRVKEDLVLPKDDLYICQVLSSKGVNILCNKKPNVPVVNYPANALLVIAPDGSVEFAIDPLASGVCDGLKSVGVATDCTGAKISGIAGDSKSKVGTYKNYALAVLLTGPDGQPYFVDQRSSTSICNELTSHPVLGSDKNVNIICKSEAPPAPAIPDVKVVADVMAQAKKANFHFVLPDAGLKFELGKYDIKPESQAHLVALANVIKQLNTKYPNAITHINFIGSADASPFFNSSAPNGKNCGVKDRNHPTPAQRRCSMDNNFDLSNNRANAVASFVRKLVEADAKTTTLYVPLGRGPVKRPKCAGSLDCAQDRYVELDFTITDQIMLGNNDISDVAKPDIGSELTSVLASEFGATKTDLSSAADVDRYFGDVNEAKASIAEAKPSGKPQKQTTKPQVKPAAKPAAKPTKGKK